MDFSEEGLLSVFQRMLKCQQTTSENSIQYSNHDVNLRSKLCMQNVKFCIHRFQNTVGLPPPGKNNPLIDSGCDSILNTKLLNTFFDYCELLLAKMQKTTLKKGQIF